MVSGKNFTMMKVFLCVFFMVFNVMVLDAKNLVYIVLEGASRNTLYALLDKGKLPHLKTIADLGNYRNLSVSEQSYSENAWGHYMYGGFHELDYSFAKQGTIYEAIQAVSPNISVQFFVSSPVKGEYEERLKTYLKSQLKQFNSMPLDYKTSNEIGLAVSRYVKSQPNPFFLIINYTNVHYYGNRYREGAQLYSSALKKCDASLGKLLKTLRDTGQFQETAFIITTTHGYEPLTQTKNGKGWIIASQPVLRKGTEMDIFPSLLDMLQLKHTYLYQSLPGSSLFLY